jgi:hypothetical protein
MQVNESIQPIIWKRKKLLPAQEMELVRFRRFSWLLIINRSGDSDFYISNNRKAVQKS